jgi:hypothetical protein
MAIIDTLKLTRALRDKGGFTQEAAEATAEALNEAFGADVATKADIALVRADITQLETATKGDIAVVKADIARLDGKLNVVIWAIGIIAALVVAILGVLLHHG